MASAGMLLLLSAGLAQAPRQFEVAVIKPTLAGANAGTSFNLFEGGRIRITNETVKLLIRAAFEIQNAQIVGGPGWLDTDRYDIEAKTGRPEKIERGELKPLLQSLLAERFNLQFHRETRELTVYALVVAKNGPRFKAKASGEVIAMNTHSGPGKSQLIGTGVSMDLLAGYIGNRLSRIVLDKTGLNETYNVTLEWAPEQGPESSEPSLVTALRKQLGLRLESQKSPAEVLVIDSLRKPSEN
jgi:uncharacterized protein (TIGR03435 family)